MARRKARVARTRLKGASKKYARGRGFKTSISSRANRLASQHRSRGVQGAPKLGSSIDDKIAYYSKVKGAKSPKKIASKRGAAAKARVTSKKLGPVTKNQAVKGHQNTQKIEAAVQKHGIPVTRDGKSFQVMDPKNLKYYKKVETVKLNDAAYFEVYQKNRLIDRIGRHPLGRVAALPLKVVKFTWKGLGQVNSVTGILFNPVTLGLGFVALAGTGYSVNQGLAWAGRQLESAEAWVLEFTGRTEEAEDLRGKVAIEAGDDPGDSFYKKLEEKEPGIAAIINSRAPSEKVRNTTAYFLKDLDIENMTFDEIEEVLNSKLERAGLFNDMHLSKPAIQDLRNYIGIKVVSPEGAKAYASLPVNERDAIHHSSAPLEIKAELATTLSKYKDNPSARYEETRRVLDKLPFSGDVARIRHELDVEREPKGYEYYSKKYGYSGSNSVDPVESKLKNIKNLIADYRIYGWGYAKYLESPRGKQLLAAVEQIEREYGIKIDIENGDYDDVIDKIILKPPHRL